MDRYMLISADCHAGAPQEMFRPYVDPDLLAEFDEHVAGRAERQWRLREQRIGNRLFDAKFMEAYEGSERVKTGGKEGSYDPHRRLQELETDGTVGEVVFPGASQEYGLPFDAGLGAIPGTIDLRIQRAGTRAYNRWLADLCSAHPGRRAGVALITIDDVDAAVEEVRWARNAGLFGGIMVPVNTGNQPTYDDPRYEPLWSACEEFAMPVHAHGGGGTPNYGSVAHASLLLKTEVGWWARRPLWFMLWSGVFERHPKMKFILTEQGWCGWVQRFLEEADYVHGSDRFAFARELLPMKPSEYWARQCLISGVHYQREIALRHETGVHNMMWGSDYPHVEGTWPHTEKDLHEAFSGIPEHELRAVMGENAARVYGFDVEVLRPIAERVGPRVEEFAAA